LESHAAILMNKCAVYAIAKSKPCFYFQPHQSFNNLEYSQYQSLTTHSPTRKKQRVSVKKNKNTEEMEDEEFFFNLKDLTGSKKEKIAIEN
jgi:hypothetical protein